MKKTPVSISCLTIVYLTLWPFSSPIYAQSVLIGNGSVGGTMSIGSFNLVTCEYTPLFSGLPFANDFVQMNNGIIYLNSYNGNNPAIYEVDVTGNVTLLYTFNTPFSGTWGIHPLSQQELLVVTGNDYWVYDINANTATFLGNIPGFNSWGGIFDFNGSIYINAYIGLTPLGFYELTLNPLSANPVLPPETWQITATSTCNNIFGLATNTGLFEINPADGTANLLCPWPLPLPPNPTGNGWASMAPDPFNNSGPLCNCTSESGTFSPAYLTPCSEESVTLPHNGNETLDPDDNFVFLLTDGNLFNPFPSNIIHTYTTTTIDFIPGVTEIGVNYRIYAVAANALGNSVDLNDPCREISSYVSIEWQEGPTLTFSENNDACGNDCREIDVNFTGTPPFELSYDVIFSNGTSTSETKVFNTYNGTFEICPPPGFEGTLTVEATNLEDANCSCTN